MDHYSWNLPNIISASRGIAAIAMLFFPVFSTPFWILYCWGGVSDMIDGPIARKMNKASELGSRIDSITDILFLVSSAILILPVISLPIWIWIWVAAIGVFKATFITLKTYRHRQLEVPHTTMNKLTGLLLFCLPFTLNFIVSAVPEAVICIIASASILEDVLITNNLHKQ